MEKKFIIRKLQLFINISISLLIICVFPSELIAQQLMIPHVPKPWSKALRLVGDGKTLYSDFTLIKDKLGRWHCIGTFGISSGSKGNGYAPGDGYSLFHAVGSSLEAPMKLRTKIQYQIKSRTAYMWAPMTIWNKDKTMAFLYYFHYLGSSKYKKNCCRLLISDSPGLETPTWHPYKGGELPEQNMVFRERDDRDFCVFWDNHLAEYLMYYTCAGTYPGFKELQSIVRVRTSTDLLHWSKPVTVMGPPPGYGCAESPFVLYRDGYYYLWISGCDYSRVSLYISKDPFNFGDPALNRIEEQPGHAPEIVKDNGKYYMACSMISTVPSKTPAAHNLDGVYIQPLTWIPANKEIEKLVTKKH